MIRRPCRSCGRGCHGHRDSSRGTVAIVKSAVEPVQPRRRWKFASRQITRCPECPASIGGEHDSLVTCERTSRIRLRTSSSGQVVTIVLLSRGPGGTQRSRLCMVLWSSLASVLRALLLRRGLSRTAIGTSYLHVLAARDEVAAFDNP